MQTRFIGLSGCLRSARRIYFRNSVIFRALQWVMLMLQTCSPRCQHFVLIFLALAFSVLCVY